MTIEANTVLHLDEELGFKKDNPEISRGLNVPVFIAVEASIVQCLAAVLLSGSTSRLLVTYAIIS